MTRKTLSFARAFCSLLMAFSVALGWLLALPR